MTETELHTFRRELLALGRRHHGDASALAGEALGEASGEAGGNLSHVPTHPADLGSDNFAQQVTLTLLANEARRLGEIAGALARIEQRAFGRCERCQQDNPRSASGPCPTPGIVWGAPGGWRQRGKGPWGGQCRRSSDREGRHGGQTRFGGSGRRERERGLVRIRGGCDGLGGGCWFGQPLAG